MTDVGQTAAPLSRRRFLQTIGAGMGALALGPVGPLIGRAQEEPIKIGVVAPLIFNFSIGVGLQRGAEIARDEINDAGGIMGRPVELVFEDNALDPRVSVQKYQKLVTQDNAVAVTGGFLDETTLPIVNNVLPRLRTPFVNSGTATSETTELVRNDYENFKYYFKLMLSTDVLTEDTANAAQGLYVDELGLENVALVSEDGGFGRDFEQFLLSRLPDVGLNVTESYRFPQDGNFDFSSVLSQVRDSEAQAFVVAIIRNNGHAFVRQWYDQGPRLPVLGINVSGQAFEYWNTMSGKVISHVYADAATGATAVTEKTLPFFNEYVARHQNQSPPTRPLFTSYTTYDALYVIKQAIERIGEAPPSPSDADAYAGYREELVLALEQTDWVGAVGRIRFQGPDDERPHHPVVRNEEGEPLLVPKWVQWQTEEGGQPDRKVVYPSTYKNSDLVAPPEMG